MRAGNLPVIEPVNTPVSLEINVLVFVSTSLGAEDRKQGVLGDTELRRRIRVLPAKLLEGPARSDVTCRARKKYNTIRAHCVNCPTRNLTSYFKNPAAYCFWGRPGPRISTQAQRTFPQRVSGPPAGIWNRSFPALRQVP